jgi:DNA-binding SARP family transcriptional activator
VAVSHDREVGQQATDAHAHSRREWRLSLLGGFALCRAGAPYDIPMTGQRLLCYLALRRLPAHRAAAVGTLWPDVSESRAAASLRTVLWRLRTIGEELVETSGAYLRLGSNVESGVENLAVAASEVCDGIHEVGDSEVREIETAGDLLPGWYDDWIIAERERLRQLHLHALEGLCERLLVSGKYSLAMEAALIAVAADPLRESAQSLLIRIDIAEGNRSEAVRHFKTYSQVIRHELGLAPSAGVARLLEEL